MIASIIKAILTVLIIKTCVLSVEMKNLYTDSRATRLDDIVTVLVMESAKAGSESGTNTNKENSASASGMNGTGVLDFLPTFGVSGGTKVGYDGKGKTSREGSLVAKISAKVIEVLENGNLVIDGSKIVEINNEKEVIQISGIVRPQDIMTNNTVLSQHISDAKITYSGRGVVATAHRPGPLARFFNWIF